MKPIEFPEQNIVFAKDQPQYLQLPAHVVDEPEGRVISCWQLTEEEILEILMSGKLWITQMSFNEKLQPIRPQTGSPFV